jgi:hypothetical protein
MKHYMMLFPCGKTKAVTFSYDDAIQSDIRFIELLNKYGLKGGFVRYDKQSEELCICTDNYNDDIHSDDWKILREVFE